MNHIKKSVKAVSGTQEWADVNFNLLNGCAHNCRYCYARAMAAQYKRILPKNWAKEIINEQALTKRIPTNKIVMVPSAHDITPKYLPQIVKILHSLLLTNNKILIVSKPHLECIKIICEDFQTFKSQIIFRFTIGSPRVLRFWEPGAPLFAERLECLKLSYNTGFYTSISIEPI